MADDQPRPISRFAMAPPEEAPPDIRDRIDAVRERTGFVPNVFLALLHRPAEWRAFVAYHDALMERDSGLTKAEREMVVVATSAVWHCPYCVVAHGAILRIRAKDPLVADFVAIDHHYADVTPRQHAMLAYALKLSAHPDQVGPADMEALRAHGFSDDDIWDIGAVTAFFAMANRLSHAMALQPNEEFHLMGRIPRDAAGPGG